MKKELHNKKKISIEKILKDYKKDLLSLRDAQKIILIKSKLNKNEGK